MVSFRYPYTWIYKSVVSGGGFDVDGNPVAPTTEDVEFTCDAQVESKTFTTNEEGDEITSSYFVSIPKGQGLTFTKGDIVVDHNGNDHRVLQFINTNLASELWVK